MEYTLSRRSLSKYLAVFAALFFIAFSVRAETGPCAEDLDKFCKGVEPGNLRLVNCLKQNEAQLSPGCKAHRDERATKLKTIRDTCQLDIERLCADVVRAKGPVKRCLKDNEARLTAECRAKFLDEKRPEEIQAEIRRATGSSGP